MDYDVTQLSAFKSRRVSQVLYDIDNIDNVINAELQFFSKDYTSPLGIGIQIIKEAVVREEKRRRATTTRVVALYFSLPIIDEIQSTTKNESS